MKLSTILCITGASSLVAGAPQLPSLSSISRSARPTLSGLPTFSGRPSFSVSVRPSASVRPTPSTRPTGSGRPTRTLSPVPTPTAEDGDDETLL